MNDDCSIYGAKIIINTIKIKIQNFIYGIPCHRKFSICSVKLNFKNNKKEEILSFSFKP